MNLTDIQKTLKKELNKDRYVHTLGVMETAASLAKNYDFPEDKAVLAGLLHDCAKCIPNEEKIRLCDKKYHILINDVERSNPGLLHAKLGAAIAEDKYKITDPDILHSIKVHTTGEPDMNILDKIIYIADYIEPGRDVAPRLDYIRKLAYEDLDKCVYEILYDTLHYLSGKKGQTDPMSKLAFEYYKQFNKE